MHNVLKLPKQVSFLVRRPRKTTEKYQKALKSFFPEISRKKIRFSLFKQDMIFWIIFPDAQNSETAKTGVFLCEALPQLSLEFFEVRGLLSYTQPQGFFSQFLFFEKIDFRKTSKNDV